MLVQCPNCRTTYKVSDDVVKGTKPAFRCSRCRHTFEIEARSNAPATEAPKKKEKPNDAPSSELSFPFVESEPTVPTTGKNDGSTPEATEEAHSAKIDAPAQGPSSIGGAQAKGEPAFGTPEPSQPAGPEPTTTDVQKKNSVVKTSPADTEAEDSASVGRILPMSPYIDQRASIFPYLTLCALLAIAFSLVTAISHAHPKFSESMVKHIPLVGGVLLRNNHLKNGILVRSLRASTQTIQGNREVLVVTGVALNQNPVVIREAQLTGRVYNEAGKELEQQTIWLGNTISPKIIRGMTSEDIPHLQNLKPLRSFEIPPGDSVPFAIVFLRATKGAKEVTCQVIAAVAEV